MFKNSDVGGMSIFKGSRFALKKNKGDEKWPLLVNKQLFWWSASITLDNNNGVLSEFEPYFSLYTLPQSVGLTACIYNAFSVSSPHLTT